MDGTDEGDIAAKWTRKGRLIENKEKPRKSNKLNRQLSISVSVCVHKATEWCVPQATTENVTGRKKKKKKNSNHQLDLRAYA